MKIDIYSHIVTPKFNEALYKVVPRESYMQGRTILSDIDSRFRLMDKYDGYKQVLVPSGKPVESLPPQDSVRLAKIANDEMAELVTKYPDRFVAGVATIPMNDMESALRETDRAIKDLKLKGIVISTSVNGKPLDLPEYMPLYEKMARYDLPVWLHPCRGEEVPNYAGEVRDRYMLNGTFGWPYETSLAMGRLVFGGVLERYPGLKIITHHCGGQVPYLEARIASFYGYGDSPPKVEARKRLKPGRPVPEYFHMFYADTALYGNTPALMCGLAFFGKDRLLFGTDMPYAGEVGDEVVNLTIRAIEAMDITNSDKKLVFQGNAGKLLHLPV